MNDPALYQKLRDLGVYVEENSALADAMNQAGAHTLTRIRQRVTDPTDDQLREYVAAAMRAVESGDYAP